jgi:hypothetical protein
MHVFWEKSCEKAPGFASGYAEASKRFLDADFAGYADF